MSGADLMLVDFVLADLFWEAPVGFVKIPRGVCSWCRDRALFDDDVELVVGLDVRPGSDAVDFVGFEPSSDVPRDSLEL